jgi:hypothetical protein
MAAACSGPNVHSVRAGRWTPKKVYLAQLLAHPGREFHVLDLVPAETGQWTALGDTGEILDERAKSAYRRRLAGSKTTSSRRAPSATPSGRGGPTTSTTS